MVQPSRMSRGFLLGSKPECLFNVADLSDDVALRQPPNLSLSDHVHRFISCDGLYRPVDRSEPQAARHSPLEESVILLQHIVEVRRWATLATPSQFTTGLQLPDCLRVGGMSIH